MLDLQSSFVFINGDKNSWRTNIESFVKTDSDCFFLTKECRAEIIGVHPFAGVPCHEIFAITSNQQNFFFRSAPAKVYLQGKQFVQIIPSEITIEHHVSESKIKYFAFDQVVRQLSKKTKTKIFFEIIYQHQNKEFELVGECKYINFSPKKKNPHIQVILGYVPFLSDKGLTFGYVACYCNDNLSGNVEFLLYDNAPFFQLHGKEAFAKRIAKNILNSMCRPFALKNFSKVISIGKSEINFFKYE